jgi:rhodanese-related sulfurtransferase
MNLLKIIGIVGLFVGLTGCNTTYKNVSVQDLLNATETNRIILDVREPDEYEAGHVSDSLLIPLGELASRSSEIPKDAPLYVICRSGNRSKQASDILIKAGFKDVRNVEGGILAWQAAGLAVE